MNTTVVIGAGVAGLAAACRLAAAGADVTVLEANPQPGGCCATTQSAGYTFHDGAIYVAVPQILDVAFAQLGLDRAALVPLRRLTPMFSARLAGGDVVTWRDRRDVRIEGRAFDSARLQDDFDRLLARWVPVLDIAVDHLMTRPFSSWRALRQSWRHLSKLRGTVAMELCRLVSDRRVRAALAGALLHTGLAPQDMPAPSILALTGMLRDGLFLPSTGMGAIPGALVKALEARGGTLHTHARVTGISVEGGRVRGVDVNGRDRLDASTVICTVNPMTTFTALIESARVPRSTARRVQRARLSHRAISVQLGVANAIEADAVLNMVLPEMERQSEVVRQDPFDVRWPVYSVPTIAAPQLAPAGAAVVEMFIPLGHTPAFGRWDPAARHAVARAAVAALGRLHRLSVVATRIRTPSDFEHQMHLFDGALYGLSPATAPHAHFAHRSAIDGLLLAGQSTYPGYGVAPAMMSGIFAADAALAA